MFISRVGAALILDMNKTSRYLWTETNPTYGHLCELRLPRRGRGGQGSLNYGAGVHLYAAGATDAHWHHTYMPLRMVVFHLEW